MFRKHRDLRLVDVEREDLLAKKNFSHNLDIMSKHETQNTCIVGKKKNLTIY